MNEMNKQIKKEVIELYKKFTNGFTCDITIYDIDCSTIETRREIKIEFSISKILDKTETYAFCFVKPAEAIIKHIIEYLNELEDKAIEILDIPLFASYRDYFEEDKLEFLRRFINKLECEFRAYREQNEH